MLRQLCLWAAVLVVGAAMEAWGIDLYRPVDGAEPWSDRRGRWMLAETPPEFRYLPAVPRQESARRGLRLEAGVHRVLIAVDRGDFERLRAHVEGLHDHDLEIAVASPGGKTVLPYRVVSLPVRGGELDLAEWCRRGVVLLQVNPAMVPVVLPFVRPREKSRGERDPLHIYLLIGQSNMAGRGSLEPEDLTVHPRVLALDREDRWRLARDPLHFDSMRCGTGPGLQFGKDMAAAHPGVTIGLVPCAVGGTRVSRWQKDGRLFREAVRRARVAMEDGILMGILWHQGEGDSYRAETAEAYAGRLSALVEDLRAELGVPAPFIAGELGRFMRSPEENLEAIREANIRLTEILPDCYFVSSEGLEHRGDRLHFDAAAARELGRRYAEKLLEHGGQ